MSDSPLKIAIIDDDSVALATIKSFVLSFFHQKRIPLRIQGYLSSEPFLNSGDTFDLVVCDIILPGMDGIQTVKTYLEKNPGTPIIFISNRDDKVFDSMKVHPLSFVRKDHFFEDVTNALDYFMSKNGEDSANHAVVATFRGSAKRIPICHVLYIEAKQHSQIVHLDSGEKIVSKEKMKSYTSDLENYGFIVCHKSFLVNCLFIKEIKNSTILLSNGEVIYISKRRIKDVKNQFLHWTLSGN